MLLSIIIICNICLGQTVFEIYIFKNWHLFSRKWDKMDEIPLTKNKSNQMNIIFNFKLSIIALIILF